ncbi:dATP pyrophosphohydrolase [Hyphococcus sp.]|uniref:dATP pyrophosphohydrolase n=1 Tax=Hyphococcus sp. TaxID=2038636 RepID=UPI0035C6C4CD
MLDKTAALEIRAVETPDDLKTFIRMANDIYADDPNYVAPLEYELLARLDAEKNPSLKGRPLKRWIAYKNGAPAGRIQALVNKAHLDRHNDGTGHFGFFESIDDQAVAHELFTTASGWLKSQGMAKILGPFNNCINEETGLLVSGFDTPPYVMMPHGRPYYTRLLETEGFHKAVDMHALQYVPRPQLMPEKRQRFIDKALSNPKVSFRTINMSDFNADIHRVIRIFNDAWSDNWGFIPFTEEQIEHMAKELRPIISPHNVVFCDYDGEPAAFALVLPDVNNITRDFGGKLLPFNWAKLIWRLKLQPVPRARMPLMGVVRKLQRKPVGTAIAYKMITMAQEANVSRGVLHSELSWILESNESMLSMLLDMGAEIYKTYRMYEKPL